MENIVEKFEKIHNYQYDYSQIVYKNCRTKIAIICKKHGVFHQNIHKHILGHGCPTCKIDKSKSNTQDFIRKSILKHGNNYDYSLVNYKGYKSKVTIICKKHGQFIQSPNNHLDGHGCRKCGGTDNLNITEFIKRSKSHHQNKYDYSKSNYISVDEPVVIICNTHGEFTQTPRIHMNGSGCPKCGIKFGIMENKWLDLYNISQENRQIKIGKYIVDGYDPITNTIYEFNGDFWHGNPKLYNPNEVNRVTGKKFSTLYNNTIKKEKFLKGKGYNIISIWESDFNHIYEKLI